MLKRFDKDMTAAPKADVLKDIVVIQELGDSENIIKKACEVINNGGNLGLSIIHEEKLEVWGIEPQASTMLKWRSPTELYSLHKYL